MGKKPKQPQYSKTFKTENTTKTNFLLSTVLFSLDIVLGVIKMMCFVYNCRYLVLAMYSWDENNEIVSGKKHGYLLFVR